MRIAIISGGASGLGLAIAKRFAEDDMTIALVDLDEAATVRAVNQLPGDGHRAYACDISDEAAVIATFGRVEQDIGPAAVLVTCAGIIGNIDAPSGSWLAASTVENWDRVMAVNARGTYLCVREMARRRSILPVAHARIITLSSLAGHVGALVTGPAYAS